MNERERLWRVSRVLRSAAQKLDASRVQQVDASQPNLESTVSGYEESDYSDPVTPEDHAFIEKEAFGAIEGGDEPDCDRVTRAPVMQRMSLQNLQQIGSVGRRT